ncbi:MAG TPA: winged helix-turn-helix domain-containing protein [Mycobacteriales bacterium]|jgi:Transcriptional regulators
MPRRMTYEEIADDLAARIESGEYPPGSLLPSVSKLAELYSVSRATVDKTLIVLRLRGLTEGVPGRGTFVRAREP